MEPEEYYYKATEGTEAGRMIKENCLELAVIRLLINYKKLLSKAENQPISHVIKSFYCYNKEKGFSHSLCEVRQCTKCKNVDKQTQ